MSAFQQVQSTAESAFLELKFEITDLEEQIEAHKLRIQNARIQIRGLKKFLDPDEACHDALKTKAKKNGKSHGESLEFQGVVS